MTLAGGLAQRNGVPSYIVVGNIGDITDLPYFLTKATFEAALGGSPWPWGYAEGNDDDGMLMTFPALRWVQDPSNQGAALPSHYTLTSTEVTTVGGIVDAYNAVINNTINMVNAQYPGTCALFDANALMADLDARHKTHFMLLLPQMENDVGAAAATTYFSLDGVHPNPKGYGLVANAVLEVINDLTDADYPMVDLNTLSWDPAYGHPLQKEANGPLLTPEAAIVLENMFQ
ncbi:hypothetical protein CSA17_04560 [bacterium DOLJORAL78_65_58]|nr:MAG: hypothetical protein CSA17_04560 [bacterium DOLJORAL78_65_58]